MARLDLSTRHLCLRIAQHAIRGASAASGATKHRIARRRAERGWRAAVLDERGSRHAFRLRASEEGSGSQAPASASGVEQCTRSEGTRLSSPNDDEEGGCTARSASAMFAPPICRRSRRNASLAELILRDGFRRIRRRRRLLGEHPRERSEPSDTASAASHQTPRVQRATRHSQRSERSNQI
jgi:hypothetical protein